MTSAPYPQVTNELLSAYIDEAVSEDERRLIEKAVAGDPEVAWRLATLRATVQLLRELPALSLPRSFLLTPEQAGQHAASAAPAKPAPDTLSPGWWQAWVHFWRAGSPVLRNAMAASFALLLVLLIAPRLVVPGSLSETSLSEAAATQTASSPLAQPAPALVQTAASDRAESRPDAAFAPPAGGQVEAAQAKAIQEAPAQQDAPLAAAKAAGQTAADVTGQAASQTAAQPVEDETLAEDSTVAAAGALNSAMPASTPASAPGARPEAGPNDGLSMAAAPAGAAAADGSSVLDAAREQMSSSAGAAPAASAVSAASDVASASAFSTGVTTAGVTETSQQAYTTEEPAAVAPASGQETGQETGASATSENPAAAVAAIAVPTTIPTAVPAAVPAAEVAETAPNSVPAASAGVADSALVVQVRPPAWLSIALQTAALLAGMATIVFALLWWRSRLPNSHA